MSFLTGQRRLYVQANAAALRWMLDRPAHRGAFLNTKLNSITLADYTDADGWRGPAMLYGWIQGRGLEALASHAAFFSHEDPDLARALDDRGRRLYRDLAALFERHGDHGYFCYDSDLTPVIRNDDGSAAPQTEAGDLFTYSDVFFVKGLIAAAARYDQRSLDRYLDRLDDVIFAVEDNRFVISEQRKLDPTRDPTRSQEFGPWMIVLGAAGLLRRLGLPDRAAFAQRFIERVLDQHWDGRSPAASDLIRDRVGDETVNPGHAIEFVGFAHEATGASADARLADELRRLLKAAFNIGFHGPGIALSVRISDGAILHPYYPWWSLPETIRAAALTYERTPSDEILTIWRRASTAFFSHYWRSDPPIAFQTRTADDVVDYVPATPDLDPGYHTGLSLLGAIEAIDRIG